SQVPEHGDGKPKLPCSLPYMDDATRGDWQLAPFEIYNRPRTFSGSDLLRNNYSARSQPLQSRRPDAVSAYKFRLRYESLRNSTPAKEKLAVNHGTTPVTDAERDELILEEARMLRKRA